MAKVEVNPVTIILAVVGALIVGLATGAITVGKYLKTKFKELIKRLREAHKKDLNIEKDKHKKDLDAKDAVIKEERSIIYELLDLLQKKDEKGRAIVDTNLGRKSFNIIKKQQNRLNNGHGLAG